MNSEAVTCVWSQDGDEDLWITACHGYFRIDDGAPSDNKMKFCCYCGKPIEEHVHDGED